ncbi:hypothetical protein T484DRAFT_1806641 [Baffinella frigidus]|nr:hypothetical protein T484DRAFT_1806641 [Cryptophyta sp. CCMP2293]
MMEIADADGDTLVAKDGSSVSLQMEDVFEGSGEARRKVGRRPSSLRRVGGGVDGAPDGEVVWSLEMEQTAHRDDPHHSEYLLLLRKIMGSIEIGIPSPNNQHQRQHRSAESARKGLQWPKEDALAGEGEGGGGEGEEEDDYTDSDGDLAEAQRDAEEAEEALEWEIVSDEEGAAAEGGTWVGATLAGHVRGGGRDAELVEVAREAANPAEDLGNPATVLERAVRDVQRGTCSSVDLRRVLFSKDSLGRFACKDDFFWDVASLISQCGTLTQLLLDGCKPGSRALTILSKALPSSAALQVLSLEGNQISDADAEDLAAGLAENRTLRRLSLRHNNIASGATSLARALSIPPTHSAYHVFVKGVYDVVSCSPLDA